MRDDEVDRQNAASSSLSPPRSPPPLRQPPRVRLVEPVVQRFDAFLPLPLGHFVRVAEFEKPWGELRQPLGFDDATLAHVLLRRQHQLVVHDPVRLALEQRGRGVDVRRRVLHERFVPLLGVFLRRVEEKPGADGAANLVEVSPRGDDVELVPVHDRQQLLPHVLRAAQGPRLQEILEAPRRGELLRLPRLVHGEQTEVVPFRLEELRLLLVRRRLLLPRPVPDVLRAEARDDGQDLVRTPQIHRGDEHLRHRRLERELRHLPPEPREQTLLVERAQVVQLLQRADQGLRRRRVHEVEVQQIVDPHRLERERRRPQVRALDLRHGRREHLVLERTLRVQAETLPRPRAARAAAPLPRARLRNRRDDERVHAHLRVEHLLLREPRIDDVVDTVDRQRRLRDVRRDDHLPAPRGRGLEDARLHLGRQGRVHREDVEVRDGRTEALHALEEHLARGVDLLLARQEQQDVTLGLGQVNLHHRDQSRVHVILRGEEGKKKRVSRFSARVSTKTSFRREEFRRERPVDGVRDFNVLLSPQGRARRLWKIAEFVSIIRRVATSGARRGKRAREENARRGVAGGFGFRFGFGFRARRVSRVPTPALSCRAPRPGTSSPGW